MDVNYKIKSTYIIVYIYNLFWVINKKNLLYGKDEISRKKP